MNTKRFLHLAILTLLLLTSCHKDQTPPPQQQTPVIQATPQDTIPIVLDISPEVKVSGVLSDSYSDSEVTYQKLRIAVNGKPLFHDTSLTAYYFKTIPLHYRKLPNGNHELMLVTDDRPGKDRLAYFVFNADRVLRNENLPSSDGHVSVAGDFLNGHYADVMDYSEAVCMHCDTEEYNPVYAYAITDSGVFLDSQATIQKTTDHFGSFHGFDFNGKLHLFVKP